MSLGRHLVQPRKDVQRWMRCLYRCLPGFSWPESDNIMQQIFFPMDMEDNVYCESVQMHCPGPLWHRCVLEQTQKCLLRKMRSLALLATAMWWLFELHCSIPYVGFIIPWCLLSLCSYNLKCCFSILIFKSYQKEREFMEGYVNLDVISSASFKFIHGSPQRAMHLTLRPIGLAPQKFSKNYASGFHH